MYANGTNVVTTKFLVATGRVVSPDHENYINEKANSLSLSLSFCATCPSLSSSLPLGERGERVLVSLLDLIRQTEPWQTQYGTGPERIRELCLVVVCILVTAFAAHFTRNRPVNIFSNEGPLESTRKYLLSASPLPFPLSSTPSRPFLAPQLLFQLPLPLVMAMRIERRVDRKLDGFRSWPRGIMFGRISIIFLFEFGRMLGIDEIWIFF